MSSSPPPPPSSSLASLGLCAGSIYTFFLLWALLQERLTTTPYTYASAPSTAYAYASTGTTTEFFRSPLLLNWMQAVGSTLVAAVYVVLTTRGGQAGGRGGRGLLDRLGLAALTRDGAERIRIRNHKAGVEVPTAAEKATAAPRSSLLPSPLLARYLAVSTLQSCSSQLGLHSLAHGISYPTLTLAKSCKLVPVLLMNVLLYRRRFPLYKYIVVLLVTAGISLFMLFSAESERKRVKAAEVGKGQHDSLLGIALLVLNLVFDGATNSTQDDVFHTYAVSGPQMMLVMNALSSLLMGASLLLPPLPGLGGAGAGAGAGSSSSSSSSELASALAFIQRHPQVLRDLTAYAAAGALGQVAIFETLQRFGSLTLVSITVTRKLFTMLLSLVVYSHRLTPWQWAGVGLVFGGLGVEAGKKRAEAKRKAVKEKTG